MDKRPYKIIIDIHEKDTPIARLLLEKDKHAEMKAGGQGYDPTADFIIVDRAGNEWGIERKSFLDCWSSICSHRVDGQLAQLIAKYPNRAILMLEAPGYFPRNLRNKEYIVKKTVYTYFNDRSLLVPCWMVVSTDHAVSLLLKFAKKAHEVKVEGRGITVIIDENEKGL